MKEDKFWTILLIVSIFLLIQGMSNIGDKDKKTAQAAQGESTAGAVGLVAFAIKKGVFWTVPMVWAFIGMAGIAPFVFGQWRNLFFPPSIPSWVWIGAFAVLIFIVMSRKK